MMNWGVNNILKSSRLLGLLAIFCLVRCTVNHGATSAEGERIVSLVPSVSMILQQTGAADKIVGCTSYCPKDSLPNAEVVADVVSADVEHVVRLKPSVVFTMDFTRPEMIEKMENLGIKVVQLHTPKNWREICEQTLQLAEFVGLGETAKDSIEAEENLIRSVTESRVLSGKRVFFQIADRPVWGATCEMYLNDFIVLSGGENVLGDLESGAIAQELLVRIKPDYIILSLEDALAQEHEQKWQQLIEGVRFIRVDPNLAGCPTPKNFRMVLQQIVSACEKD